MLFRSLAAVLFPKTTTTPAVLFKRSALVLLSFCLQDDKCVGLKFSVSLCITPVLSLSLSCSLLLCLALVLGSLPCVVRCARSLHGMGRVRSFLLLPYTRGRWGRSVVVPLSSRTRGRARWLHGRLLGSATARESESGAHLRRTESVSL